MIDQLPPFLQTFNDAIENVENLLSITRASDLQVQACRAVEELLDLVVSEKAGAISRGDENYANMLLGCESVSHMLLAELKMWLLLKEERPNEAWNQLVTAQMECIDASRSHKLFHYLERHSKLLGVIEQVVFPPQVFISSGMIVKVQRCSVCGKDYEDCEHLTGKPYMGEFCHIIAGDVELDHVAIVNQPADKRCRVMTFETQDGVRDRMTWRLTPKEGQRDERETP
jgi:hypothetical protein